MSFFHPFSTLHFVVTNFIVYACFFCLFILLFQNSSTTMFRFCIVFAVLAVAVAFQMKINKIVGAVASVGVCLAPLAPALADGAVSASTRYRARTSYGAKIVDLAPAAEKGDFAAFDNKKAVAAFDLFISGSNKKVKHFFSCFFRCCCYIIFGF